MTSGGRARGFGCDWASPGTLAATIEAHFRTPRRDRERNEGEAGMPSPGKPVLSARIEFCERPQTSIALERRKTFCRRREGGERSTRSPATEQTPNPRNSRRELAASGIPD